MTTMTPPTSFAELQGRMAAADAARRRGLPRTVVVVPSRTIDKWHEPAAETRAYEERLLCSVLELRDPALRMTYVTSTPIAPAIVGYYLSLLPRRQRADARRRLTLVAVGDSSGRPLSAKLLDRPGLLGRLRRSIPDPEACHLVPYTTTRLEAEVALALGIPMYGAAPEHAHFGTKSGGRALFAAAGVPHPAGVENVASVAALVAAIARLRAAQPGLAEVVVKLDEGVSGEGNAIVDLRALPAPGAPGAAAAVAARVAGMTLEAEGVGVAAYLAKLAARGGVVEERISGRELHSPSVQLQVTPRGEVEILSTHDQILGGRRGQSYLGCRFPADPSYAPAISVLAARVGRRLAAAGVLGRFAVDFVVARQAGGGWRAYAIEVNLRKGGTTHPFETLVHLTGGSYDAARATFATPAGAPRHYVATDHLEAPPLRALGRDGLLRLARQRRDLRFDRLGRTGVVFHMLSSLDALGRTGATAIADTAPGAEALYREVEATLLAEAEAAAAAVAAAPPPRRPAAARLAAAR
jgi:hypothetical protein